MTTVFICEQCGKEVTGTEYRDGYLLFEQHYECPNCGYRRHWAYGHRMPDDSDYKKDSTEGV